MISTDDLAMLNRTFSDLFGKIFEEGLHKQRNRKRKKKTFAMSRMAETNQAINQSMNQSQVFELEPQIKTDPDLSQDQYLETERGDEQEPRLSTLEPETDVIRADILEFLRQIFKAAERIDAAGLSLKFVYGEPDMDQSSKVPDAFAPHRLANLKRWLQDLECWGTFEPLSSQCFDMELTRACGYAKLV